MLTSASRDGVRKGVIPPLSTPYRVLSTLLKVYLPSYDTREAGVFSSPPHACNGEWEREQSSSAQKCLGGILWNASVRDLPMDTEKISGRTSKPTTERSSLKSTLQTTGTCILPACPVYSQYICLRLPCNLFTWLKKTWSRWGKSHSVSCKCLTVWKREECFYQSPHPLTHMHIFTLRSAVMPAQTLVQDDF